MTHRLPAPLAALLLFFALLAGPAVAQAPSDPAVVRLQERVDDLDVALREATGEVERLRFQLQRAEAAISRMEAQIARLSAPPTAQEMSAPAPQAAPPPQQTQPAPQQSAQQPAQPPADPQAAYAAALSQLQRGELAAAEQGFAALLQAYPQHSSVPDARYWYGQTLLARDAHREAGAQFLAVVRDHPNAPRSGDALVYLGVSLRRAGEAQRACQVFNQAAGRVQRLSAEVRAVYERERAAARCG